MFGYFAKQRQAEREMFLEVIRDVMQSTDRGQQLIIEQTKLLQQLTSFFDFSGTPRHRVMNDQTEFNFEQEQAKDEHKVY
jgi:hypothetical protein